MSSGGTPFVTVSMAEILLMQDQLADAGKMIAVLEQQQPEDERVHALRARLEQKKRSGESEQQGCDAIGVDQVLLSMGGKTLRVQWELTDEGLDMARRRVRYSGRSIVRLFTAAPGPRGVRTTLQDIDLENHIAAMDVSGTPERAVFTAAVGFLGNSGEFVPMATALPLSSL